MNGLNAVPGIAAGPALAAHPGVSRVTFTGSTATGRAVMGALSNNLAVPTMELGGKNAALVSEDADLDAALRTILEGMFFNEGEACTSTARIVVHESIYDELLARFVAAAEKLVVGDRFDPSTHIGPVVDAKQRDRILSLIEVGRREGARLVYQGETLRSSSSWPSVDVGPRGEE